jgi:hypothetical protein
MDTEIFHTERMREERGRERYRERERDFLSGEQVKREEEGIIKR